jgi:hypothetical protein
MLRYSLSALIALCSFVVAFVVLIGMGLQPEDRLDPFAAYDALAPGQPVAVLDDYPCRFTPIPAEGIADTTFCQIYPESGPIRLITVLGQGDIIQGLSFALDGIQMGHLAQRWGRPDAVQNNRGFIITRWESGVQAAAQTVGWFTYQSGVELLVLRDNTITRIP